MPKLNDITETSMQRPVAPKLVEDDANYDVNLRPRGFDEYVGQEQVKGWAKHRSPTLSRGIWA